MTRPPRHPAFDSPTIMWEIVALIHEGKSLRQIAKAIGATPPTVRKWCAHFVPELLPAVAENGRKTTGRRRLTCRVTTREAVLAMLDEGMSAAAVAAKVGCTATTIRNYKNDRHERLRDAARKNGSGTGTNSVGAGPLPQGNP